MSNDFSKGNVSTTILAQAIPLCIAQLVQLGYNVVDRIYIGRMPGDGSMALTGIGLVFPLTTLISAFTLLFGNGGSPLFAIARGAGEEKKAQKYLGQVASMLIATSIILMILCYLLRKPILYAFGASDASYAFADPYLRIYLLGTPCIMFASGMNGFINAMGYPRIGMGTIMVGAIINLILDPVFIYGFHLGVRGAAIATIISQLISFLWVLHFLLGPKNTYPIQRRYLLPDWRMIREITALGFAGFIMAGTNCAVQVVCNKMLHIYGGDLYVGIMTVINSVREILSLPGSGLADGSKPVLGYNLGAKKYKRLKACIRFMGVTCFVYMTVAWLCVVLFPGQIMGIFSNDPELLATGGPVLQIYFFGFFFMAFQFAAQATFTALKCTKRAVFFSLLRKAFIVVPLTLILPAVGFGVTGVFLAEPISNLIGGLASFTTMILTLYRKLPNEDM